VRDTNQCDKVNDVLSGAEVFNTVTWFVLSFLQHTHRGLFPLQQSLGGKTPDVLEYKYYRIPPFELLTQ
jgi:hypothetical protein